MRHFNFYVLTGIFSFFLIGCFGKPDGFGEDTHLFVVADQETWQEMEPVIRETFERTLRTPQPEVVFQIFWVAPEEFNQYATRKNLVFIGLLNTEGTINRKVQAMLAPEVKRRVEEGSAFYFPKIDPWANHQLLLVFAGSSIDELRTKLIDNKAFLYNLFEEKLLASTATQMFEQLEQTELSAEILRKYGWTVRIQHDYFTNVERPQDKFYMVRRSLPGRERWLGVHWIDDADPAVLEPEWAMNLRDKITMKFYEGDRVNRDPQYLRFDDVDFCGRRAVLVEGLWENEVKIAGGPFRNYTFYDESTGRIYMVDIAVFFPGGEKEPFLRQLDVMAHTFKTAAEYKSEGS